MDKPVIIITGPTASGKTNLGIALAQKIDGEIISADSRQIYKGFIIGTSSPINPPVPYHLVNFLDPHIRFNAMEFKRLAENLIKDITARGKYAIVVGGTGLYINALIGKFFSGELKDENIRNWLYLRHKSGENLFAELKNIDPDLAKKLHPNDFVRISRALEVYYITGKPMSFFHKHGPYIAPPFNYKKFIITLDREELYKRINDRVERMIEMGFVNEVKNLLAQGISEDAPAFESVGYKEIIAYIKGAITLEHAIERIKQRTRQYARRQLIWFKKEKDAVVLNLSEISENDAEKIIMESLEC